MCILFETIEAVLVQVGREIALLWRIFIKCVGLLLVFCSDSTILLGQCSGGWGIWGDEVYHMVWIESLGKIPTGSAGSQVRSDGVPES